MRYVVGYGPNQRGIDGINLAVTLARSQSATLDIVAVLPGDAPSFHMYSPDRAYNAALDKQGNEWLDDALKHVPDDVTAEVHLRRAESITEGLIEEASDPDRGDREAVIVVGTSRRVRVGKLRLGSIADALLHSAPVPVVLAPAGYEPQPGITRITCATGTREGAEVLLDVAIREASSRRIPLRLMSLVKVAKDGSAEQRADWTGMAEGHVARLASKAEAKLAQGCEVTSVIGDGESLEEAVQALDFAASEIVLVGSSRLAQPKRLFIGASVNKILRALPVPMMVVPRDYEIPGDG